MTSAPYPPCCLCATPSGVGLRHQVSRAVPAPAARLWPWARAGAGRRLGAAAATGSTCAGAQSEQSQSAEVAQQSRLEAESAPGVAGQLCSSWFRGCPRHDYAGCGLPRGGAGVGGSGRVGLQRGEWRQRQRRRGRAARRRLQPSPSSFPAATLHTAAALHTAAHLGVPHVAMQLAAVRPHQAGNSSG